MKWMEVQIKTTAESEEMITNAIHELGCDGVSVEESGSLNRKRDTSLGQWYEYPLNDIPEGQVVIQGYFAEEEFSASYVDVIREKIAELEAFDIDIGTTLGLPIIFTRPVDEEDWATSWKKYYKPLRITDRLTVKPTWEVYDAEADELVIELDPGMAFGTGTHATTSLCLQTLEEAIHGGEDVLDVGTGSGVLAIAAVKLGARHVLALDLDPVAVTSAGENAALNHMEKQITVKESDLLGVLKTGQSLGVTIPVQTVVANILAEIIVRLIDDVNQVLAPGGTFIASGIWKNKEALVEDELRKAGFAIVKKNRAEDWLAFVARRKM